MQTSITSSSDCARKSSPPALAPMPVNAFFWKATRKRCVRSTCCLKQSVWPKAFATELRSVSISNSVAGFLAFRAFLTSKSRIKFLSKRWHFSFHSAQRSQFPGLNLIAQNQFADSGRGAHRAITASHPAAIPIDFDWSSH